MGEPSADGPGSSAPGDTDTDAEPTPLPHPSEGVPPISVSVHEIEAAAQRLDRGHGPFAVDAERASGFRYSNRAYLIQIRRAGSGTVLIDPVSHGGDPLEALRPVAEVLSNDEWILHSADQDLPCLAEVGMRPPALYDTELAGRLAGFERVNLATMVERLLGFGLAKGHGAADWSKRPLPAEWLNYAALDVELLIELRTAIADVLAAQGKTDWAAQEFDYLRDVGLTDQGAVRRDRWRRTSGIHRVRDQRRLAAVRELWLTRDRIAQRRDIAPRRILPDSAIIDAALANPTTVEELVALPVFGGRNQRRSAATWLAALDEARRTKNPPPESEPPNGPPPPARWSRRKPEAAARLEAARSALSQVSERVHVPTENLVSPDLVRRLCWDWTATPDPLDAVETFLRAGQARPWQRELVDPALARALQAPPAPAQDGDVEIDASAEKFE
ncbi:ribonuclease D [Mycobacterium sp. E2479]|uniref:HRDC domain-containing protein n=1 Tax=Mycobacterium sp. E2479 TaxID=1834134 RepID=UPI000801974F|nr:ribonuclease D [Mycobacterium sp. E2479]OBH55451.1 3'-5' exonuclease [Mycobacterium sp. E2479]